MKLDVTKEYGTVHGSDDDRRFFQNGKFFNADHDEIAPGAPNPVAVPETLIRKRTKAEEEQYQKDVQEAAALLAAKK